MNILNRYKNKSPKIYEQKVNKLIKAIGKRAGIDNDVSIRKTIGGKEHITMHKKFELITTHTGRRSFATNADKAGIPRTQIMKITGHRTEAAFLKYLRTSKEENALQLAEHVFFK